MTTWKIEKLKEYGFAPEKILIQIIFKGEEWVAGKLKELKLNKIYGDCAMCGRPLTKAATPRRHKLCSEKCRKLWAYRDMESTPIQCISCGKMYFPARNWKHYPVKKRNYCSKGCFYADLRRRKMLRSLVGPSGEITKSVGKVL